MCCPKISVVIPTHNRVEYISETLNCIINQTLKPYEIIVVDNGSSDNTEDVIKENFNEKVIYVKNNGSITPGAGRNYGLNIATGDYIQFFDSDDVMTKNKFEVQAKILDKNPSIQGVYCPYVQAEDKNGQWIQHDCILQYEKTSLRFMPTKILKGLFVPVWTFLFRTDFVRECQKWPEDLFAYEDYYYLFSMFKNGLKPLHTNECCVFYRVHQNQITGSDFTDKKRDADKVVCLSRILNNYKLGVCEKNIAETMKARVTGNFDEYSKFKFVIVNKLMRVENKLNRIFTGTDWTIAHSPQPDPKIFQHYCSLL